MDNAEIKALEVCALCKSYGGKKVLDNVSFSVDRGEIVGFLGPNGAGKSTTMNIITGYLSPGSGDVSVCGIHTLENPLEARKKIGYLPEIPPLYTDMTVIEYLNFVYDLKKCGGKKEEKEQHIAECMELVKIQDVAQRMIKNLSKGYKQRVGIAQALLGNPDVLILDEPTAGLDPAQIMEIRDLIRHLGTSRTVILSTHILQEVTAVCNKVVIINKGRIKACDTLENLENGENNTYRILLAAEAEACTAVLEQLGVAYEPADAEDGAAFTIIVPREEDRRSEISGAFAAAGIGLLEFYSTTQSIEDVFRQYTEDSDVSETSELPEIAEENAEPAAEEALESAENETEENGQ